MQQPFANGPTNELLVPVPCCIAGLCKREAAFHTNATTSTHPPPPPLDVRRHASVTFFIPG